MEAEDVSELEPAVLPKSPMLGTIENRCSSDYSRLCKVGSSAMSWARALVLQLPRLRLWKSVAGRNGLCPQAWLHGGRSCIF